MSTAKIVLFSLLGVIVFSLFYVMSAYNGLVMQEQEIEAQWAQVETQYQRRYDLIPNLVSSAKGLMEQEKELFGTLAKARSAYTGARSLNAKVEATTQMEGALGRLLAVVENYPELKSDRAVLALMDEVAGSENRVATERRRYNEAVKKFNQQIRTFPSRFVALFFGFESKSYFELTTPEAANAPKVEF